jgi:TPR repeat protein
MTKMRIRATVFQVGLTAWLTLVAMTGAVAAEPIEDGSAAYQRHDYETALRLLRTPAEQGNAEAQLLLGFMYEDGKGVPQDYAEAARWFRKAAEQGNIAAQGTLGSMYLDGLGVPKDPAQAVRWLRKAAEQGLPPAQSVLGELAEATPRLRNGIASPPAKALPPRNTISASFTTTAMG